MECTRIGRRLRLWHLFGSLRCWMSSVQRAYAEETHWRKRPTVEDQLGISSITEGLQDSFGAALGSNDDGRTTRWSLELFRVVGTPLFLGLAKILGVLNNSQWHNPCRAQSLQWRLYVLRIETRIWKGKGCFLTKNQDRSYWLDDITKSISQKSSWTAFDKHQLYRFSLWSYPQHQKPILASRWWHAHRRKQSSHGHYWNHPKCIHQVLVEHISASIPAHL